MRLVGLLLFVLAGCVYSAPEPEVRIVDPVVEIDPRSGRGHAYFTAFTDNDPTRLTRTTGEGNPIPVDDHGRPFDPDVLTFAPGEPLVLEPGTGRVALTLPPGTALPAELPLRLHFEPVGVVEVRVPVRRLEPAAGPALIDRPTSNDRSNGGEY